MEYNLQLLHEICLQENWGFPVLFFVVRKDGQSKIELITQKNRLKGGFPRKVVRVRGRYTNR